MKRDDVAICQFLIENENLNWNWKQNNRKKDVSEKKIKSLSLIITVVIIINNKGWRLILFNNSKFFSSLFLTKRNLFEYIWYDDDSNVFFCSKIAMYR